MRSSTALCSARGWGEGGGGVVDKNCIIRVLKSVTLYRISHLGSRTGKENSLATLRAWGDQLTK